MMQKKCMNCRREYEIPSTDSQYKKFAQNPGALYICKNCSRSMQQDAQSFTGLNPDMLDQHDKHLR
ncbi:DUF2197 domain-containing protein [Peribacillus sp. SCS-26]|uniref:DUF2197 domain-containing protein n=1 Tax=Paraperibacillus marinus TaxID=3115295 RepID=UPI0039062124